MEIPKSLKFTGKDSSIVGSKREVLIKAIYEKLKLNQKLNKKVDKDFFGSVPSIFVGSYGYPRVRTGFLSTQDYNNNNNPLLWSKEGESKYDLMKIIRLRSELVNSHVYTSVKDIRTKINDGMKEVSLSSKPIDAEINLEKKPEFSISIKQDSLPHGPSVALKKMRITQNPKIPKIVDKTESDTDLKAGDAVSYLYKKGLDEHYITKIFTGGNLGVKKERKIVPTKWSITAVDDILGKEISLNQIRDFNEHDFSAYFGGYMGNYYLSLVFPGPWSFELFETYVGKGLQNPLDYSSSNDYENTFGRKSYAQNTVGGYYASRLAVLEHMKQTKRKGRVLMLRFITDKYWAPLGVWVVREASRKAFLNKPLIFDSEERLLLYSKAFILKKFQLDLDKIFKESKILTDFVNQKSILGYFS